MCWILKKMNGKVKARNYAAIQIFEKERGKVGERKDVSWRVSGP